MTQKKCVISIRSVLAVMATILFSTACGGGSSGGSGDSGSSNPSVTAAQPAMSEKPMDEIVNTRLIPVLDNLFNQVKASGLDTEIQGVKVFAPTSGDKFLPGKVAIGFSYLLLKTPPSDPKYANYLEGYRAIADLTLATTNETWGIYYYLSALWKLKKAGLLDGANPAVKATTLAALKTNLDWRNFVDAANYSLKNGLPTNYYGVAFSVARLRYLLGWEGPEASEALLQKMIGHYRTFSAFGFSDETDGSGRFDRYSVLLIGEIMQRLTETGMPVSTADMAALKGWLRQSVDVILLRLNPAGNGFDYGRSLSAYGDTAFAEVLSAAQAHNVLTPAETDIAYAFATRITAKYAEFWYDDELKSLNMWDKGRRTDGYRGKGRILGENLSLSHQLIYTNNLWKEAGYAANAPVSTQKLLNYLNTLPRSALTKFAGFDGQPTTYDRGLVTYRDGLRVISLPVVNGAQTYHRTNPYFAIPYSYNMLSGVADAQWPQLQPKFTFAAAPPAAKAVIPAAYQKNLRTQRSADGQILTVSYEQDAMNGVDVSVPVKDTRITSTTTYTFEPGRITRVDTYTPAGVQSLEKIEMEFGSYSTGTSAEGQRFTYANGDVTSFEVTGLQTCAVADVSNDTNYNTPTGALKTSVRCSSAAQQLDKPLTIKWVLTYRSPGLASFVPK
jgi:hypothetical protein